jgi:hypothetical protein
MEGAEQLATLHADVKMLPIDSITIIESFLRPLNPDIVADYADQMEAGDKFPLIHVFGEKRILGGGRHRIEATRDIGRSYIACKVHPGDQREAMLFAAGENADHGYRRSDEDKRRAVMLLLADPEWSRWSDREIGRQCHVTHPLVGRRRREMLAGVGAAAPTGNVTSGAGSGNRTYKNKHGQKSTMRTDNIGRRKTAEEEGDPSPSMPNGTTEDFSINTAEQEPSSTAAAALHISTPALPEPAKNESEHGGTDDIQSPTSLQAGDKTDPVPPRHQARELLRRIATLIDFESFLELAQQVYPELSGRLMDQASRKKIQRNRMTPAVPRLLRVRMSFEALGSCSLVPLLGHTPKYYKLETGRARKDSAIHHLDPCPRCPDWDG